MRINSEQIWYKVRPRIIRVDVRVIHLRGTLLEVSGVVHTELRAVLRSVDAGCSVLRGVEKIQMNRNKN